MLFFQQLSQLLRVSGVCLFIFEAVNSQNCCLHLYDKQDNAAVM